MTAPRDTTDAQVAELLEDLAETLQTAIGTLARLHGQLITEALAETEPNTDEQWTALTEHLSAGHNLQVTTNGQPSLVELVATHAAEHEHDVHDSGCCPDHDTDDHQPVQDRAAELARQRRAETAEATQ